MKLLWLIKSGYKTFVLFLKNRFIKTRKKLLKVKKIDFNDSLSALNEKSFQIKKYVWHMG